MLLGNALETRLLIRAEVELRTGTVGITASPEVNLLFINKVHQEAKEQRCLVAIDTWSTGVTPEILETKDAEVLFGGATDVAHWSQRIERGEAQVEWWSCRVWRPKELFTEDDNRPAYLPMVRQRWRSRTAHTILAQGQIGGARRPGPAGRSARTIAALGVRAQRRTRRSIPLRARAARPRHRRRSPSDWAAQCPENLRFCNEYGSFWLIAD